MKTIRLTAAQAMVRYLANQFNEDGERFLAGCWAIFWFAQTTLAL